MKCFCSEEIPSLREQPCEAGRTGNTMCDVLDKMMSHAEPTRKDGYDSDWLGSSIEENASPYLSLVDLYSFYLSTQYSSKQIIDYLGDFVSRNELFD